MATLNPTNAIATQAVHHAAAQLAALDWIDQEAARVEQLWKALLFLGQQPDPALRQASQTTLWSWAMAHWLPARVAG